MGKLNAQRVARATKPGQLWGRAGALFASDACVRQVMGLSIHAERQDQVSRAGLGFGYHPQARARACC